MLKNISLYDIIKDAAIIIVVLFLYFKDNVINVNPTIDGKELLSQNIESKVHIDTIPFYYPVPRYIDIKPQAPTVTLRNDSLLKIYNNPYEDSLIKGTIKTVNFKDGTMLSQGLTYKPKFPKYIKKDSIVTITNEVTNPKAYLYLGLGGYIGLNQFDIIPQVGFKFKNDNFVSVGYGIRNNTINFNIYKPLKFKKKNKIRLL